MMNNEELPPLGEDDDDSPWSVEGGPEAADNEPDTNPSWDAPVSGEAGATSAVGGDEPGVGPSGADPPGDESGAGPFRADPPGPDAEASSIGGDPPDGELPGADLPHPDGVIARPDAPAMRRSRRRPRKRPTRRRARRLGKQEGVWRERLEVELPPRLNFLSLGIGFAAGCVFCFCLMAWGFLPGSTIVREPGSPPAQHPNMQMARPGGGEAASAEEPVTKAEEPGGHDEPPAEEVETTVEKMGDEEPPAEDAEKKAERLGGDDETPAAGAEKTVEKTGGDDKKSNEDPETESR